MRHVARGARYTVLASTAGSAKYYLSLDGAKSAYDVLACADDAKTIAEADETNDCAASATKITVTQ